MTDASWGKRCSHSSASARLRALLTPMELAPRKTKILSPTLATVSPSQGESSQAPGRARAARRSRAGRSSFVAAPAMSARPVPPRLVSGPSPGGGAHLPKLLLQVTDLVAQPRRALEVQVGGRLVHLGGELLEEPGALCRRHVGRPAGGSAGGDANVGRHGSAARPAPATGLHATGTEQLLG